MADPIDDFLASGGATPLAAPTSAAPASTTDLVDEWLASGGKAPLVAEQPAQPVSSDESVKRLVAHEATQMGASVLGGFRSLYDLATGKSIADTDQRYKDFVREHSYQPPDANSQSLVQTYDKASASPANPLTWPSRAADIVAENQVGPGSSVEDYLARQAAKKRGQAFMSQEDPAAAPILSGALQFGVGAAQAVSGLKETPAPVAEDHPLAGAAQAENARLAKIKAQGEQAGLELPEGGTPAQHAKAAVTNQPIANAMAREELDLPKDAPLTPQLLGKARETYASPAYEAVKSEPTIELGPKYEEAIDALHDIPAEFSGKLKPPETVMSGAEAVDLSKKFRFRANQYDRQASITGSPEASDLAELHRGAAEAIEDAVRDHFEAAGKPEVAKAWDDARVYTAKTYSVQNALDGAGNVRVTNLKQQLLKNKPLSGNLETLANLGAQYPQAFKLTQQSAPTPGLARRAAAATVPHLTTAAGAGLGSVLGPWGTAAGAVGGRVVGENLANRINPP